METLFERVRARVRGATLAQWALLAVLAAAALLRLRDLGAESLWLDELTTLLQTTWPARRIVAESVIRGTPPLYYLLQLVVYNMLPSSEWALRLTSALADIVSVYLVYAVGRRVIGAWPAVVAAGLSAVSIPLLWFAQEARAYSLGMMLSLLAALTLLRLIEEPSWARLAWHTAVAVALLYTHVYATFALIGIELWVLLSPRLLKRLGAYWWTGAVIAVVCYIPWVVALVRQIGIRAEVAEQGEWSLAAPKGVLVPLIAAISDLAPGPHRTIPYDGPSNWAVPVFVGLVVFGLLGRLAFEAAERQAAVFGLSSGERRLLLGLWAGMLLVGGILISQTVLPIYSWRMATQAAPVVFMMVASGLNQLWRPAAVFLAIALLSLTMAGLRPYYLDEGWSHAYEKEQWRDAIRYAEQYGEPGDAVIVTANWYVARMHEYGDMLDAELPEMHGIPRVISEEELTSRVLLAVEGADRVAVVASHVPVDENGLTGVERNLIADGWQLTNEGDVRLIRLRTYEKR